MKLEERETAWPSGSTVMPGMSASVGCRDRADHVVRGRRRLGAHEDAPVKSCLRASNFWGMSQTWMLWIGLEDRRKVEGRKCTASSGLGRGVWRTCSPLRPCR
jgi:hypothetical protein